MKLVSDGWLNSPLRSSGKRPHPVHPRSFTANAHFRTLATSSPSVAPLSFSLSSRKPTPQTPGPRRVTSAARNSLPRSPNTSMTCVPLPPPLPSVPTDWLTADNTKGAPLPLRTHLHGTYLPCGPYHPARRVRPATAGIRPPASPTSGGEQLLSDASVGVEEQTRGLI